MLVNLFMGITFGFAAAVQPGPFQTFIISRALYNGWRATLPAAFAPLISDVPIVALVLLVLMQVPPWMEHVLHLAGGLFVLFLAVGAFRSYRNYTVGKAVTLQSARQNLFKAALVNFLNPNPYLSWSLVMGPLFLKAWNEQPASGIALIAGFYLAMILTVMGIIILFSTIEKGSGKFQDVIIRDFFGRTSGSHPHSFRRIRHIEWKGPGIDFAAFFPGGFLLQKFKGSPSG